MQTITRMFGRELLSKIEDRSPPLTLIFMNELLRGFETLAQMWGSPIYSRADGLDIHLDVCLPDNWAPILVAYAATFQNQYRPNIVLHIDPHPGYNFSPDKGRVLLYSGGAESFLLGNYYLYCDRLNLPGVDDRCDCGVEFPSVMAAILLGYKEIIVGDEYSYEMDANCPFNSKDFCTTVGEAFGVTVRSPLTEAKVGKTDVLREIVRRGDLEKIIPCFKTEAARYSNQSIMGSNIEASGHQNYCGNCSKCWRTYVSLQQIMEKVPFQCVDGCANRQLERVTSFLTKGSYPFYNRRDAQSVFLLSAARECNSGGFKSMHYWIDELFKDVSSKTITYAQYCEYKRG